MAETTTNNIIGDNTPNCPGNKNIQSAVISQNAPNDTNVLWLKPYNNQYAIRVNSGGRWVNCGVSCTTKGNATIINTQETKLISLGGQSREFSINAKAIVVFLENYDQYIDIDEVLATKSMLLSDLFTTSEDTAIKFQATVGTLPDETTNVLAIIPIIKPGYTGLAKTTVHFTLPIETPVTIFVLQPTDGLFEFVELFAAVPNVCDWPIFIPFNEEVYSYMNDNWNKYLTRVYFYQINQTNDSYYTTTSTTSGTTIDIKFAECSVEKDGIHYFNIQCIETPHV